MNDMDNVPHIGMKILISDGATHNGKVRFWNVEITKMDLDQVEYVTCETPEYLASIGFVTGGRQIHVVSTLGSFIEKMRNAERLA